MRQKFYPDLLNNKNVSLYSENVQLKSYRGTNEWFSVFDYKTGPFISYTPDV